MVCKEVPYRQTHMDQWRFLKLGDHETNGFHIKKNHQQVIWFRSCCMILKFRILENPNMIIWVSPRQNWWLQSDPCQVWRSPWPSRGITQHQQPTPRGSAAIRSMRSANPRFLWKKGTGGWWPHNMKDAPYLLTIPGPEAPTPCLVGVPRCDAQDVYWKVWDVVQNRWQNMANPIWNPVKLKMSHQENEGLRSDEPRDLQAKTSTLYAMKLRRPLDLETKRDTV